MNIVQDGIEHIIQKWDTNNPNLYDISYKLYCHNEVIDTVYSYFGIRNISINGNKIFLNEEQAVLKNLKEYNGKHRLFSNGYKYEGQPVIMSEYGGIVINRNEGWGYGKQAKDEKEFIARYSKLTKIIYKIPYISGYCYTQLTDVQQEINGLMDSARNYKIHPNIIKNINSMNNEEIIPLESK